MTALRSLLRPPWQFLCPRLEVRSFNQASELFERYSRPSSTVNSCIGSRGIASAAGAVHETSRSRTAFDTNDTSSRAAKKVRVNNSKLPSTNTARSTTRNSNNALPNLDKMVGPQLYQLLSTTSRAGQRDETERIVRYLVENRGAAPSSDLFSALILCNTDPKKGSVARVEALLGQMEAAGIEIDLRAAHAVLAVVKVYPYHPLRLAVLDYLHQSWKTLTPEGTIDNLQGLLKESQYELFLSAIDEARSSGIVVHESLMTEAAIHFASAGEFDASLQMLHDAWDQAASKPEGHTIDVDAYYRILEMAAADRHYELCRFVFKLAVERDRFQPNSGLCFLLLDTFSKSGDAPLTQRVISFLVDRQEELSEFHFEKLVAADLNIGDLPGAITMMLTPSFVALNASQQVFVPFYEYLAGLPELPEKAFGIVLALHRRAPEDQKPTVQTELVNTILESCIVQHHDLPGAIKIYRELHSVCEQGPNQRTFNILLRGCADGPRPRKDLAKFIYGEMQAFGLKTSGNGHAEAYLETLETMVRVCVRAGDIEAARWYIKQSQGRLSDELLERAE